MTWCYLGVRGIRESKMLRFGTKNPQRNPAVHLPGTVEKLVNLDVVKERLSK